MHGGDVNAVEQKFEGPVRLSAPRDFGTKKHDPSASERSVDDLRRLIQILLTPRPAASKRLRRVDPRDGFHAFLAGFRQQSKRGAVVEEDIRSLLHTKGERIRVVDACLQNRAWNIEILRRQWNFSARARRSLD